MKKNLLFGLLIFVLVALPWFASRAESASTPSKPIELIFASPNPPQAPISRVAKQWGDTIEQKTGSAVKFVYYWSNTLMPSAEVVKGVKVGTADVSYLFASMQDYMPLTYNVTYLPFMGYPSMSAEVKIYRQLYNKFSALREEFAGLRLLACSVMPPVQIHMTKRVVKVPSDLKGFKMATITGGQIAKMVNLAGGAPVQIPTADLNMSLNTGVVEGWVDHFAVVNIFGCMPLLPYHTIFGADDRGISMGMDTLIMNLDKFNKLPPDVQKIFEEASAWYSDEMVRVNQGEISRATNGAKELKHTLTYLTLQEVQMWADIATPLHQDWIAGMEAKGKPARAIYEEARRLIKEYGK